MFHTMTLSLALVGFLGLTACKGAGSESVESTKLPVPAQAAQPQKPETGSATGAAAEAKTIFAQRCEMCHGTDGLGNGAAAAALNPKPRNYTDKAWQASVTDDYLAKVIVEGGAAVGKSMLMPGNPDLAEKSEVVKELVKIIRSFGAK